MRVPNTLHRGADQTDVEKIATAPAKPWLNEWGFDGKWVDHKQIAVLTSPGGKVGVPLPYRDLHLVLGPTADGNPVRFRVTIDGVSAGDNHGVDTDAQGNGIVTDHRLYQLGKAEGSRHRPRLHDRVRRPWGAGFFLHVRMNGNRQMENACFMTSSRKFGISPDRQRLCFPPGVLRPSDRRAVAFLQLGEASTYWTRRWERSCPGSHTAALPEHVRLYLYGRSAALRLLKMKR